MKNKKTPIAVEGIPFILIALVITIVISTLLHFFAPGALIYVSIPLAILTLFVMAFFRNPKREIPDGPGVIVSPADGKVIDIRKVKGNDLLGSESNRISVFMSVFNVHVNRIPMAGKVVKIAYFPGKFLVASMDKASEENERSAVVIENRDGVRILVVQIAGLVARRIVSYLKEGMVVERGVRMGLIRFGSRLDLYLPTDCEVVVDVGDRVKGGQTIMGRLKGVK